MGPGMGTGTGATVRGIGWAVAAALFTLDNACLRIFSKLAFSCIPDT